MSVLYDTLCVVRTSLLNAVGAKHISGGEKININNILNHIVDELEVYGDFMTEITTRMTEDQLVDLGFNYISDDSNLMMFPIWLYPFIPDMTILLDSTGEATIKGVDSIGIVNDHWINAGFYYVKY
jgi:hypothetical protein